MTWTVTTKAYANDMQPWGDNPDMFLIVYNVGEQPVASANIMIKSGMCGAGGLWNSGIWKSQLDKAMGLI